MTALPLVNDGVYILRGTSYQYRCRQVLTPRDDGLTHLLQPLHNDQNAPVAVVKNDCINGLGGLHVAHMLDFTGRIIGHEHTTGCPHTSTAESTD